MAQVKIEIVANGNGVTFNPKVQTATSLDNLFWVNNDEGAAHQPAPDASNPNAWMPYPIPAKLPGEDAPSSRGMAFAPPPQGKTSYDVPYICAKHPNSQTETGTIKVTG